MSVYIIIYRIINSALSYYLLRNDCPEVGNPPQPAVQQKSASPAPPRAGAQTVRAQSMTSPAKLEEIQEQHRTAIDNEDMVNVFYATLRRHLKPSPQAYIRVYERKFGTSTQ